MIQWSVLEMFFHQKLEFTILNQITWAAVLVWLSERLVWRVAVVSGGVLRPDCLVMRGEGGEGSRGEPKMGEGGEPVCVHDGAHMIVRAK